MNVMDMNSLYTQSLGLLLPKNSQVVKAPGKRKRLPNAISKDRVLTKAPTAFKQSYKAYLDQFKEQNLFLDDFKSLKEIFEKTLNKDFQDYATQLPPINKTPLKLVAKQVDLKINEKITITTHKRFLASKPLKSKKKESNFDFKVNDLSVVSRSLSTKSFQTAGQGNESEEKPRLNESKTDNNREHKKRIYFKKQETGKTDRKVVDFREKREGSARNKRGFKRRAGAKEVVDKGTMNLSSEFSRNETESDEDRMNVYEDFGYI